MQFSVIVALFAVSALAAPAVDHKEARSIISDVENGVQDVKNKITGGGTTTTAAAPSGTAAAPAASGSCSLVKCAAALGPAAVGCGSAAAQALVDPISDVACLAAALNDVANKPAECDGCSSKL